MGKRFWIPFWTIFAACAAGILLAANWLEATGLINRDPNDLVSMTLFIGLMFCVPLSFFASAFAAAEVEHRPWWHNYKKGRQGNFHLCW